MAHFTSKTYSSRTFSRSRRPSLQHDTDDHVSQEPPVRPSTSTVNRTLQQAYVSVDQDRGDCASTPVSSAVVTSHGLIAISLRHNVRIELTVDRSVRLIDTQNKVVVSVSPNANNCAFLHPNGRVYQDDLKIETIIYDSRGNDKFVKILNKGIIFTSGKSALKYLLDSAGVRTTSEKFSNLSNDFSVHVFKCDATYGPSEVSKAIILLKEAQYSSASNGFESWSINNINITQDCDGRVCLCRQDIPVVVKMSPLNGAATITSPNIHCTGSIGMNGHLFIKRNDQRLHFDGTQLVVRHSGRSAGFDERHHFRVY